MADKQRLRTYYSVGVDASLSTTWQMWSHGTSFYLINVSLGGLKISLHGMDARHPGADHFRIEPDPRSGKGIAAAAGIVVNEPHGGWPLKFAGKSHPLGFHAIRLRTTDDACQLADGLMKGVVRGSSMHGLVPPPGPGWAADLDLIFAQVPRGFHAVNTSFAHLTVTKGTSEARMALRTGRPGERSGFVLSNDFGVVLRGETRCHRLDLYPLPNHLRPREADRVKRSVTIDVDSDGVLWIVEDATRGPAVPQAAPSSTP